MNYLKQYKTLHKISPDYGTTAPMYMPEVRLVIDYIKPKTVLDYGCGKAALIRELAQYYPDIKFYGYDPAIPGRDRLPVKKADLVINTDVLEHIPESMLPGVVKKIATISDNAFFALHHAMAYQILPNGENAHCTVKPPQWYYDLFAGYFENPYPLPGREAWLSAMITFSPTVDFLRAYNQMMCPPAAVAAPAPAELTKQGILLPRWLGRAAACFIPKQKNRRHFRTKYIG